jgi:hypothetical protein
MKFEIKKCFQILSLLMMGMLILGSCKENDDSDDNLVEFSNVEISGDEEVPPIDSDATGTFNGTYDKTTKVLTYTLTFSGIEPTNMHFHKGAVGVGGGPVVIPISSSPYTSPINSATPALTDEQETDLLNGDWYVNIHSAAYPPGEIRGQVD